MTQVYKLRELEPDDVYERGETVKIRIEVRDAVSTTLSTPSDITITITDPCGGTLVNAASMSSDGTGIYYYNYTLASDSNYGDYDVLVNCIGSDSSSSRLRTDFFLFSYNMIRAIRRYSGINKNSLSDKDIAGIGYDALLEALDDVFEYHHDEEPKCDPDYGVLFNGTNKVVRTKCGYLADHDYDGNVYGAALSGNCTPDVSGYWIDSDYAKHDAHIVIDDITTGRITVTQDDDTTAIPNDNNGVFISYYTKHESYDEKIFKAAVAYLAAHNATQSLLDIHNATMADLPSNQRKLEINISRFKSKYIELLERITRPMIGGA